MFDIPQIAIFLLAYAAVLVIGEVLKRREFDRSPDKQMRYRSLPLGYKMICWLVVAPQCAAIAVSPWFWVSGMISYAWLEIACVSWYRRSGLL